MRPCSSSFMFSFKRVGCVSQRLGSATFDRISAALTLETLAVWPGAGHIAFLLSELCILILQAGSRSCCRRNWFWRPGVTDLHHSGAVFMPATLQGPHAVTIALLSFSSGKHVFAQSQTAVNHRKLLFQP